LHVIFNGTITQQHNMQLRSGKKIGERLYISPKALLNSIYLDTDVDTMHAGGWLAKVQWTTGTLNYISEYSDEKLASIDDTNDWLREVYLRSVEIIYKVIQLSYTDTAKAFTAKTKCTLIRLLEAAQYLQLITGKVLWDTRNRPHIREFLESQTDDAEHLYRVLRHLISNENIAHDYKIYTYNSGEYSDEETWDYYFGVHTDYQEYANEDHFMNQIDDCMYGEIRYWNWRMLE